MSDSHAFTSSNHRSNSVQFTQTQKTRTRSATHINFPRMYRTSRRVSDGSGTGSRLAGAQLPRSAAPLFISIWED